MFTKKELKKDVGYMHIKSKNKLCQKLIFVLKFLTRMILHIWSQSFSSSFEKNVILLKIVFFDHFWPKFSSLQQSYT